MLRMTLLCGLLVAGLAAGRAVLAAGDTGLNTERSDSAQQVTDEVINEFDATNLLACSLELTNETSCSEGMKACGDQCCNKNEACCTKADGTHYCDSGRCPARK